MVSFVNVFVHDRYGWIKCIMYRKSSVVSVCVVYILFHLHFCTHAVVSQMQMTRYII